MIEIRLIEETDCLKALTNLIHRAYRPLAEMGLRYWSTHQTVEDTRQRISLGDCYVATEDEQIVGTIVLRRPDTHAQHPWYERPEVTSFNQFAVDPEYQGRGVGAKLLDWVEQRARELGMEELACDTAEGAQHLIEMYQRRGYREVGKADWEGTNYVSVVLSKRLG